jgi:eukaryotic-like serine/threonine-protein kinase
MPASSELLRESRYQQVVPIAPGLSEAVDSLRSMRVLIRQIGQHGPQLNRLSNVAIPFVLRFVETFHDGDAAFLVTDRAEGDDLGTLLERNRSAFPVEDVLGWADEVLDAIEAIHRAGVFNLGIRPSTLFLGPDGSLKFDPWPAVASAADPAAAVNYSPLELIWTGLDAASQKVMLGAYDERSERILKEPADARTDLYSLAATLYHLLTGSAPMDALERSIEMLDGKPDPLRPPSSAADVPQAFSDAIMKAMSVRREYRFDSAMIMRQVLRTVELRSAQLTSAHGSGDADRAAGISPTLPLQDVVAEEFAIAETDLDLLGLYCDDAVTDGSDVPLPSLEFSRPPRPSRVWMTAVPAMIVIAGIIGVWVWAAGSSKSGEPAGTASVPSAVAAVSSAAPSPDPVPQTIEPPAVPSPSVEAAEPHETRPEARPPQTAAAKKKPQEVPAERPQRKKAVTVDDLINDN